MAFDRGLRQGELAGDLGSEAGNCPVGQGCPGRWPEDVSATLPLRAPISWPSETAEGQNAAAPGRPGPLRGIPELGIRALDRGRCRAGLAQRSDRHALRACRALEHRSGAPPRISKTLEDCGDSSLLGRQRDLHEMLGEEPDLHLMAARHRAREQVVRAGIAVLLLVVAVQNLRLGQDPVEHLHALRAGLERQGEGQPPQRPERLELRAVLVQPGLARAGHQRVAARRAPEVRVSGPVSVLMERSFPRTRPRARSSPIWSPICVLRATRTWAWWGEGTIASGTGRRMPPPRLGRDQPDRGRWHPQPTNRTRPADPGPRAPPPGDATAIRSPASPVTPPRSASPGRPRTSRAPRPLSRPR
jgi:hypothetical protein